MPLLIIIEITLLIIIQITLLIIIQNKKLGVKEDEVF